MINHKLIPLVERGLSPPNFLKLYELSLDDLSGWQNEIKKKIEKGSSIDFTNKKLCYINQLVLMN